MEKINMEKIKEFFKTRAAKSIVVASSALLIGLAVYLNYQWFYDPAGSLGYGDNNMDDNYSDSQNASGEAQNDYFTSTALDRQEARDEALDVLKMVTESQESSAEAKAEAQAKISKIAVDIQNESNIETLVKAKGFEDCVAVINGDGATIVVKTGGDETLLPNQIAQINEIVYEQAQIKPVNIKITARK